MTRRHTTIRLLCALAAAILLASCSGRDTAEMPKSRSGAETPERLIHFVQEYVTVEPSPGLTRVVGIYHIRNESNAAAEMGVLYPFPVDRDHAPPHIVRLWEQTPDGYRTKGFVRRDDDILLTLLFEPREEKVFKVEYVQRIRKRHAVYIVTTTRQWERAIDLAEFEFRIPPTLDGVTLSFEPDRTESRGDTVVHYMRQEQFYPDEDLTVTWTAER